MLVQLRRYSAAIDPEFVSGTGSEMERLWAGWRATYIEEVTADDSRGGDVFTRILGSGLTDEETHIVWRGTYTFAILNRYPYISGHVLVMPYREVGDLEDLTPDEHTEVWSAVTDCVRAIKGAYRPHGLNIGVNLGAAAGAGIPSHLHVHVMPRWDADSNFMTSVAETRVLPESLPDTWRKLRAAWPEPRQ
jgi:diadenosine tetraphosphate (Ap4A) HIT family hydrolase